MNDRIQELTTLVTKNTKCACAYHKQERSVSFDESSRTVVYMGLCVLFLATALVSWFADMVIYIGRIPIPWWFYFFPALLFLVLTFRHALSSGITLMLLDQELRCGKIRIPFASIQQDQLSIQQHNGRHEIWIQHPQLRKRLCAFDNKDAQLAAQCLRLLQYVLHELNAPQSLVSQQRGQGGLTPVQHWIMGACAIFARVNHFPVDRLGDQALLAALTRHKLVSMLKNDWSIEDRETLLENIRNLVNLGHRSDMGYSHQVAAMPREHRQEYIALLKHIGYIVSKGKLFPEHALSPGGLQETQPLRRLVQLRYGAEGEATLDALLALDEHFNDAEKERQLMVELHLLRSLAASPREALQEVNWAPVLDAMAQEAGQEGADLARRYRYWFDSLIAAQPRGIELFMEIEGLRLTMYQDPDFFQEEINRIEMLAPPGETQQADERYMIWDYTRALMLYRWGYMLGWLKEDYCWESMLPLAMEIQRHYTSWQDMAEAYLRGRELWAGGMAEGMDRFKEAVQELSTTPMSPWKIAPWDMQLSPDWR